MKTLGIIFSVLVCVAVAGCMVPKDDYEKVSAELTNAQQLTKEANDAHLKVAEENRQLQTTLRETQTKLNPVQKELDEVKAQLADSKATHKKDVSTLEAENEKLQTECDDAAAKTKKTKNQLTTCQSELEVAKKKNQGLLEMIDRQKLIIKDLEKSNAAASKNIDPKTGPSSTPQK
ncbi:MAG: hypothetical protein KAR11_01945 [Phycisphaerae bacterium]|nr:hypothetical protein [Phycisphaerae bacterium]